MTTFGAEVKAALARARAGQLVGPRTEADLARTIGLRASTLHRKLRGERPMVPYVERRIRAALGMET